MKRALLAILVLILIASSAVACGDDWEEKSLPEISRQVTQVAVQRFQCVTDLMNDFDWREISRHSGNAFITAALYCVQELFEDQEARTDFYNCIRFNHEKFNAREFTRHGGNQLIAFGILCVPE